MKTNHLHLKTHELHSLTDICVRGAAPIRLAIAVGIALCGCSPEHAAIAEPAERQPQPRYALGVGGEGGVVFRLDQFSGEVCSFVLTRAAPELMGCTTPEPADFTFTEEELRDIERKPAK